MFAAAGLHRAFAAAGRHGLPVNFLCWGMLDKGLPHIKQHPDTVIVIDHLGLQQPFEPPAPPKPWEELPSVLELAKYPNVAIKVSGAPSYSKLPYPFRDMHDRTRQVFDAFGPSRTFWGTDITRMPCSYKECVTMFTEELPWLTGADKDAVMGRALCDWIGWDLR